MEFKISTADLSKGLYMAQGIVEKKTTMPILSNVLLTASSEGRLRITATDLEVGMVAEHKANVQTEGSMAVSAKHFYEIVRALPKEEVSIKKLENQWAEIVCGSIEYRLLGMPSEDFQSLPDFSSAKMFPVDAKVLRNMVEKTIYAVSTDETRFNLSGCYFEKLVSGQFRMVSTDGHRMAMIDAPLVQDPERSPFGKGVIIPRKGLMEVRRLVESESGECLLGLSDNNLVFRIGDVTLVMRLLDGQFPEYQQVIPERQKIILEMERKQLIDSLRRISILSNDRTMGIKLQLRAGALRVTTSNPDLGEAKEDLEIGYKGPDLSVGFNARYLLDALSAIESDKVDMTFEDDLSPCVFHPKDHGSYTCVVMPMRI